MQHMMKFIQKQNRPSNREASTIGKSNTATTEPNRYTHTSYWQRILGNQAVQWISKSQIEELGTRLTAMPGGIHAKLPISQPGDESEQEADRIAEMVMQVSVHQLPRSCSFDGGSLKHQTEHTPHHALRLQTEQPEPGDTQQPDGSAIVNEVLASPGHALDPAARTFMELRFGCDFGHVRVHHDGKAAESAKSIRALAYTNGHDIVFSNGQYNPNTQAGRRLLAHELVHTMQQGDHVLRRKIDFTEPKPALSDPIPIVIGGRNILGNTLPVFNGNPLPENAIKKEYKETIFQVLLPLTYRFSNVQDGKSCKVDPDQFNINVSANVRAITEPKDEKWSGVYPISNLSSPPTECQKRTGNIEIDLQGKPTSMALYKKVLTHENEHIKDLKRVSNDKLKPYHDFLLGLTGIGKNDRECAENIVKQTEKKGAQAANDFVDEWLDSVQVYDKPGGTHHSKFISKVNAACTQIHIEES
jgi:hypothetical protein